MIAMLAPAAVPEDPALHQKIWFYLTSRGETDEAQFFFAVAAIVVLLLAFAWRTIRLRQQTDPAAKANWMRWADRSISALLLVAALCSATQYFYGSRNGSTWLHTWDLYHQVIGTKYFSEIGYFRLYECTWEVDAENARHFARVTEMRNIATVAVQPIAEVIGERDCVDAFTPERWQQFGADIEAFYNLGGTSFWPKLFTDKGFNGTPFHAWIVSVLSTDRPITEAGLLPIAQLDVWLMAIAFGFVIWAWDIKTASIVVLFFCADFPNRFGHMGGSILRFDYIAMLIIALALLKKERFGLAGICVAWATAERVFPGVFAAGLALKAGIELVATRKLHRQYLYFGLGFAGGLLVMFGLSLTMADDVHGGFQHWLQWWDNMREHTRHTRGFRVGFKHMFMMDGNVTDKHRFMGWSKKTAMFESRSHFYWLAMLIMFAPLIVAARKLDAVTFAAIFAAAGFLTLTIATRYYYSMMVLFLLVDRKLFEDRKQLLLAALLMLTAAVLPKLVSVTSSVPFHFNTATTAVFTAYFVILGALLWIDPWLRDRGLPPDERDT
jgi:hypothetical protein